MRNRLTLFILLALLLAACSSVAPAVESAQPLAPAETQAPPAAEPAQPQPSDTPAAMEEPAAPSPAGAQVYQIVPGESRLQYEVGEVFLEDNRFAVAIGVTPQVSGEITLDPAAPQSASLGVITADVSQFKSDSARRDGAIQNRFLESSSYPMVTFTATQIEGLPDTYSEGETLTLTVSGDVTIRDVTRAETFTVTVTLQGGALSGSAATTILMSNYGFGPISIGGILNTEDEVKLTLNFVARP
jgi:polyisoprenoid-binding protein YceI